jgi:hypothetical protein
MNRGPLGEEKSDTGESLARLAELADVVSRQQQIVPSSGNPAANAGFGSGAPLRKRPVDIQDPTSPSKKLKKEKLIRRLMVVSDSVHTMLKCGLQSLKIW